MTSSLRVSPGPSLARTFLSAAERNQARPALMVDETSVSYDELAGRAGRIAARLSAFARSEPLLGAVLGSRTAATYEGVLGTLISGAGYVPLNPKLPDERSAFMLAASGASTLVVDPLDVHRLGAVLARVKKPLLVVVPHAHSTTDLAASHPGHTFLCQVDLDAVDPILSPPAIDLDAIAYLLFTSGTTGTPKGVMVTHRNVLHHLDVAWGRYQLTPNDRVSQTFDLTFDLSVFDIFASLGCGASLHVLPAKALLAPDKFIKARELTVWFSVPSVAMMMRSFNLLGPGVFPSLRLSLFCGERLPAIIAESWQTAAPNSQIDNLYGPTEVTIACTRYTWRGDSSVEECVDGGVPIGEPYPGMAAAVVDERLQLAAPGEKGELCMRGPQVTPGYWLDDAKTRERYVSMPWASGPDNRWYRTGDVAYMRDDGQLIHCGRNDEQVKLHGHRIELGEIEHVLSEIAGTTFAAVVAYPRDENGPKGLMGAVARTQLDGLTIVKAAKARLPAYMVPREVVVLEDLPLNSNGKIDKKKVLEIIAARDALRRAPPKE